MVSYHHIRIVQYLLEFVKLNVSSNLILWYTSNVNIWGLSLICVFLWTYKVSLFNPYTNLCKLYSLIYPWSLNNPALAGWRAYIPGSGLAER